MIYGYIINVLIHIFLMTRYINWILCVNLELKKFWVLSMGWIAYLFFNYMISLYFLIQYFIRYMISALVEFGFSWPDKIKALKNCTIQDAQYTSYVCFNFLFLFLRHNYSVWLWPPFIIFLFQYYEYWDFRFLLLCLVSQNLMITSCLYK